jgi:hypothetical protein
MWVFFSPILLDCFLHAMIACKKQSLQRNGLYTLQWRWVGLQWKIRGMRLILIRMSMCVQWCLEKINLRPSFPKIIISLHMQTKLGSNCYRYNTLQGMQHPSNKPRSIRCDYIYILNCSRTASCKPLSITIWIDRAALNQCVSKHRDWHQ